MHPRTEAQNARALQRHYTQSVAFRRGTTTLGAQQVALAQSTGAARERRGEGSQAAQADVEVWGPPELNIQVGDRFTWNGSACVVIFVRPDRAAATVAEAIVQQ